ncbi:unknown [Brachyspira sp. CAG:484]|nr:unknown [Brachyspira sp. CAG:484]
MQVGKTQYLIRPKQKDYGMLSPNQGPIPSNQKFNRDIERPLNHNSQNLSFKGLSISKAINKIMYAQDKEVTYSANVLFDKTKNHLGEMVKKHYDHVKSSEMAKKLVKFDGDKITFRKKTIPHLIWDGLIYPFKILPFDILNGMVELIGKIKPFKKWAQRVLEKPFFRNIRQRSKIESEVSSLKGLCETATKLKDKPDAEISSKFFQQSVKMFDPRTGNYDTKHERALCRMVSGLPPAIMLATDAYNLSRMMDDDPAAAKKEKKARFRQEMSRLVMNAYLMLVTFGALNKFINQSAAGSMLMTGATTLLTETYSRLRNGKHIKRLTPEEARAENEKNNAPEKDIKPLTFKSDMKPASQPKEQQKPLLSFSTIMKASAGVIAAGFAVKGARKYIPGVEDALKTITEPFNKKYKSLTQIADFRISGDKFDEIVRVLRENDFGKLADKYEQVAATARNADGSISLGVKDKKVKPLIDFVIAPFKFVWNTITLPYKLVDKGVKAAINKKDPKAPVKDIEALAKSIEKIGREATKKGYSKEKFQTFVKDNIMKAFNTDTMSSVPNHELANLAKTAATAATMWFLMTDNYNMVMLKSNGNDKEGAETKFKERFVQECSRLFYSTLLIDLFNNTFQKQYNASLLGMSWITLTDTTISEILTRKSVGMTITPHTRDELMAIEEKQNNATGALKGYYNFMQRLTGKRSIKSYEVKPKNTRNTASQNTKTAAVQEPSMQGSSILNKMIKG